MTSHRNDRKSAGAAGFLLASALCVGVSLDTSWRMFGDVLGIVGWERVLMFSALEVAFIACGYSMRASSRQYGTPGPSRLLVWALAALASYFAVVVAGPLGGSVRAAVVLCGVVFLHHALGIEIRSQGVQQTGTLARVGRELRERSLSRLGLADDERDALTRTRERAARRAARLALAPRAVARDARLSRALRASRVGIDDRARAHLLAELAVLRHGRALADLDLPAPWADLTGAGATATDPGDRDRSPVTAPTGQPAHATDPARPVTPKAGDLLPDRVTTPATAPATATGHTDDQVKHRREVKAAATTADAVAYAVSVTGQDRPAPAPVAKWLTAHGRETTPEAVRSALRRARDRADRQGGGERAA